MASKGRFPRMVDDGNLEKGTVNAEFTSSSNHLRLSPGAAAILSFCDGHRCVEEVAACLSLDSGLPCATAAVEAVVGDFVRLGVVQVDERAKEVVSLGPVRHDCTGCGCSCESQLVGPLDDPFMAEVVAVHQAVAAEVESVRGVQPVVQGRTRQGEVLRFLHFPNKQCLFLNAERLCAIHAICGAEAKPEACRRFPFVAVEVEGAIRVGVRPTCYTAHRSYRDGSEADLSELASTAILRPVLRDRDPEDLDEGRYHEARILQWLQDERVGLVELLYRSAGCSARLPGRTQLPQGFCHTFLGLLQKMVDRLVPWVTSLAHTLHGQHLQRLHQALAEVSVEACQNAPGQPTWDAFGRHTIASAIFLRETSRFPSMPIGAMVFLFGHFVATWYAATRPGLSEDAAFDAYGTALAAWNRMMTQGPCFTALFPETEDFGLLTRLLESGDL